MPRTLTLSPQEANDRLAELTELLVAVVDGGASVGFFRPLAGIDAAAFWRSRLADLVAERSLLVVALADDGTAPGTIVGTVMVVLATQPNGRHRAEIAKLLVHPDHRRQGVGAALLAAAESEARTKGRTLLLLDTIPGLDAHRIYLRAGWVDVGAVEGYAASVDGELQPTMFMARRLDAQPER